jgi:putative inorganic carbon (hco3(-)) transporter
MFQNLSERRMLGNGGLIAFLVGLAALIVGLIATNQSALATSIGLGLLVILAILAKPNLATLIVVFVLFTNAAVIAVQFHNVPSLVSVSLPALLVFPLASLVVIRREKIILSPILLPIFLFFAVQVAGTLFASEFRTEATNNLVTFIAEGLGLFFLITNVVRTERMLRSATWALLIAGALIGALSFYQQLTHTYSNNYWGFAQISNAAFSTGQTTLDGNVQQWRMEGMIGEKNRYAQVMLMLVPLGMFRVFSEKQTVLRILAGVATALIALGASMAFSRGAAVGFALMLIIMVFMRYIKLYQIIVILLGLVLLLEAVPQYRERLTSLEGLTSMFSDGETNTSAADGATLSRLTEMGAAGLVFLDHPVIGVGPGLFRYYYEEYAELVGLRVKSTERSAHDLYLQVAAEHGLLGLLALLATLYMTMRNLSRVRKRWMAENPELSNMATAYMLSIVTYLTTGIFLHFAFIRYFWLIMALAAAVIYIAEQRALAARQSNPDEMALAPVGREGLQVMPPTRAY